MMRMCEPHVRRLRSVCCDLGLESMISRDADHLAARKSRNDPYDLDPLDVMHRSLMALGQTIVNRNEIDAHMVGCPLCFFAMEAIRAGWVDSLAKAVAKRVRDAQAQKLSDIERNRELERAQR